MTAPAPVRAMALVHAIAIVEREIAAEAKEASNFKGEPHEWCRNNAGRMALLADRLAPLVGAVVRSQSDSVRVRIAGVTATSTQGITGALRNWLTAARKRAQS